MASSSSAPHQGRGPTPLDSDPDCSGFIVQIKAKGGETIRVPKSDLVFAEKLKDQLENPRDSELVIYIALENIDIAVLRKVVEFLEHLRKVHKYGMSYKDCIEFEGQFLDLESQKPLIFAMIRASSELGISELNNFLSQMIADDINGMSVQSILRAYAVSPDTALN